MYKVGDKVRVREDLEVDECYGDQYFVEEMQEYMGNEVTIDCVCGDCYHIEEDGGEFNWTDGMLEKITKKKIQAGDRVRINKDCTIGELTANKWNKACKDTLKFFEQNRKKLDATFVVKEVSERGNAVIVGEDGTDLYVNFNVLDVIERKAKEMTIEQVCEALGYDIKIVKTGNHDDED